jgi:hypothetical protein
LKVISKKTYFLLASGKSLKKRAGSGSGSVSLSKRQGSGTLYKDNSAFYNVLDTDSLNPDPGLVESGSMDSMNSMSKTFKMNPE